jgi:hypothetical protein
MNNKNAFKLLWTGISDWRYYNSPKHLALFIQCIVNAFYKDVDGIKRGSFKTSRPKLAKEMGVSVRTLDMLLHDLSTGDKPELMVYKDRGLNGYTMITVLEYNNYQDKNMQPLQVNDDDNVQKLQDNMQKLTDNMQKLTNKRATVAPYITSNNNINNNNNNIVDEVEYLNELIENYPKEPNSTTLVELANLFNSLSTDERLIAVNFIQQVKLIWDSNGKEDKLQLFPQLLVVIKEGRYKHPIAKAKVIPYGIKTELKAYQQYQQADIDYAADAENFFKK